MMPSYPPLQAGETLQLKADAPGKVMSNALVLTTVMSVEKSSTPTITGQV
ncbi:hypothetical protein PALU110988_26260 [Paenibacillus lupini]